MIPTYHIEPLARIKFPLVNKFYRNVNAKNKASGNDGIWVARHDSHIVAATRLAPIPGDYWLLTGVFVDQDHRGRGLARALIIESCDNQPVIYTFSLSHLTTFYQQLGFKLILPEHLPCELAQRFNAYVRQGRKIVAMINA